MQEQTAKADLIFKYNRKLVDEDQLVLKEIIGDGVDEGNAIAIADCGDVDAPIDEFVDEGPIVIGAHRTPTSALHLSIEDVN